MSRSKLKGVSVLTGKIMGNFLKMSMFFWSKWEFFSPFWQKYSFEKHLGENTDFVPKRSYDFSQFTSTIEQLLYKVAQKHTTFLALTKIMRKQKNTQNVPNFVKMGEIIRPFWQKYSHFEKIGEIFCLFLQIFLWFLCWERGMNPWFLGKYTFSVIMGHLVIINVK